MKMKPVEYTQGCTDGGCCLRIGPVGQHTNGGCHCLRDLPTELRIKIMRKFAHERERLAAAEARLRVYEPEPGKCEHGVAEGDWCEPCNKAYKDAADQAAKGGRDATA